ncbi:MAG: hypothetical protein OEM84_00040 [Acidimicrobiia bacterium]|nr:hypothetical protein [Acidimicrobiia bacterium]
MLDELDFRIERTLIDGERAAVTWSETARTWDGLPWADHGVDVFRVQHDHITMLHENSDVRMVHRHFAHYEV